MPITKATGYKTSDGVVYATIEEAQTAEMCGLLNITNGSSGLDKQRIEMLAADLVTTQRDAILAILTTGPRSRPATRKRAGTTNPKRATKGQAAAGFKAMREATVDNNDVVRQVAVDPIHAER